MGLLGGREGVGCNFKGSDHSRVTEKVTFEQRLGEGEGANHLVIWGRVQAEAPATAKALKQRSTCCLRSHDGGQCSLEQSSPGEELEEVRPESSQRAL